MPTRIKMAKQRLLLAKLAMGMVRAVAVGYLHDDQFGSASNEVLLLIAVYIGQAEGKPMTAHKLASYVGIPRATVIRKLRSMKEAGLIELGDDGTASLIVDKMNAPGMVAAIEGAIQAVHKTSAELSKMDS